MWCEWLSHPWGAQSWNHQTWEGTGESRTVSPGSCWCPQHPLPSLQSHKPPAEIPFCPFLQDPCRQSSQNPPGAAAQRHRSDNFILIQGFKIGFQAASSHPPNRCCLPGCLLSLGDKSCGITAAGWAQNYISIIFYLLPVCASFPVKNEVYCFGKIKKV